MFNKFHSFSIILLTPSQIKSGFIVILLAANQYITMTLSNFDFIPAKCALNFDAQLKFGPDILCAFLLLLLMLGQKG